VPKAAVPIVLAALVPANISWLRPVARGYERAIPVAVWLARTQGAAPKLRETLKTFFADNRGEMVPVKLQPREDRAEIAPAAETVNEIPSPVREDSDQDPETVERSAGVL